MRFFWTLLAMGLQVWPIAPAARAQGSRKDDIVFNARGVPLAGAAVRVCAMPAAGQPCTPLAQIYSDSALTQALANPTTTDGLGNYNFYAAPGKYMLEISGPGITTRQLPNVILPSDPTAPSFSSLSSSGGISAFSLTLSGNLSVNGNTTVNGSLVSGTLNLTNQSTPPGTAGAGTVNLYTKTTDKRLYYKDETGTEIGPIANTTGAQTNVTNTFTAPQNIDADFHTKGPNPWFDVTRYGGFLSATSTPASTTGSINAASTTLTLASAQDFATGQGIVVWGAGAATALSTPGQATVTPIGVTGGGTSYSYQLIAEDRLGGLTAASTAGTTVVGQAALGLTTFTLTQGVRSGGTTTYTCSGTCALQAGQSVNISGFNGSTNDMNGVKTVVTAPGSTFTVQDANLPDRTDTSGSPTVGAMACNTLSFASGSYSGANTLRYWIYRKVGAGAYSLAAVAQGLDPFYIDCGTNVNSAPAYVPAAPPGAAAPQYLVSTILSGGGTTTLTLASAATTTVSGATVLHDNSLAWKACLQAAYTNAGGTCVIPSGGWFVTNATTDLSAISVGSVSARTLFNGSNVYLNQTVIPVTATDFEGTPASWSSFTYVTGATFYGTANPLFYIPPAVSAVHFNRLVLRASYQQQSAVYTDDNSGGGTCCNTWDNVNFLGNTGTRPAIIKGGFDFIFHGGMCNGGSTFGTPPCMEFTNSSVAVNGAGQSQVPGRVVVDGMNEAGTAFQIDNFPNLTYMSGGYAYLFKGGLFESGVGPYLRINLQGANLPQYSEFAVRDVVGADLAIGYGTPFIDTSNTGLPFMELSHLNVSGTEPLFVAGAGGSQGTMLYTSRAGGGYIAADNVQQVNLGTLPYGYQSGGESTVNNTPFMAQNGGRLAYAMTAPTVPSTGVSAGGSVPVGTHSYTITGIDADGMESNLSAAVTATTTSGNQTVTVTPPTLPAGAIGWRAYRDGGRAGGVFCGPPYYAAPGVNFVDTYASPCGNSFVYTGGGSSFLSSSGVTSYAIKNTGSMTSPSINNILFVDGVKYATLGSALAACPVLGCVVYDNMAETFSTNPFASLPANTFAEVHLLRQTWVTNASIIVPNKSQLIGSGRGDAAATGTVIQAGASFPASTPVVQMGTSSQINMGVRIQNLTIDCNNKTGAIGLQNLWSQEESNAARILLMNCPGGNLDIETTGAQNSGPFEDFEMLNQASCTNCGATTVPVIVKNVVAFRGLHGATVNALGATQPNVGIQIDSQGTFNDIHCEHITACFVAGSQSATSGTIIANPECGPSITDCVKFSNAFSSQNLSALGVYSVGTNLITDQINGNTLTVAGEGSSVGTYFLGNGSTPLPLLTTSANFTTTPKKIASGTSTLGNTSIAATTCNAAVTTAASGALTTDVIQWAYASAPSGTTDGKLILSPYVTANNVNFVLCNPTAGALVPTGLVVNWRVVR
jgi:hypothetical protein